MRVSYKKLWKSLRAVFRDRMFCQLARKNQCGGDFQTTGSEHEREGNLI